MNTKFANGVGLPRTLPKYCSPQLWIDASIESFDPEPFRVIKPIRVRIRRLRESLYEADCPDLPVALIGGDVHNVYRGLKATLIGVFTGDLRPDPVPGLVAPDLSVLAGYIARKSRHDA